MRISTVILLLLVLFPRPAFAGYFTVCGYAWWWDDRQDFQTDTGSYLPDQNETNQRMGGLKVQIWDEDGECADFLCSEPEGDDDLLGETYADSSGFYCFEDIGDLEDIYILTTFETEWGQIKVPTSTGSAAVKIGTYPTLYDFGGGGSGFFAKSINITRWNETKNSSPAHCDNETEVNTLFSSLETYSNLLAVIADADKRVDDGTLGINGHDNRFTVYWPDGPDDECTDNGGSISFGFDEFCISNGQQLNNHAVAHELGHNVHRRALNFSGPVTDGSCLGSHSWSSNEYDKCSTAEGWASFFASAIYFYPHAVNPFWASSNLNLEGDTRAGNQNWAKCVSYHTNPFTPYRREGNVARFFWDLYDSTNEDESSSGTCTAGCGDCSGGFDNSTVPLSTLVAQWSDFDPGTGPGDNNESGYNGRNVWDYYTNYNAACSELHLNCLEDQDAP